jgi:glutathione peroxidase
VIRLLTILALLGLFAAPALADDKKPASPLDFKMKGIDGKDVDLAKYKGKVVLFVNVASKCGLTPQYDALQKVYDKYSKDGFVIIGVPCNQFGGQEPGTEEDIVKFCTTNYKVTFPLLSKNDVNGGEACDLYKFMTDKETSKFPGKIEWNFEKFLVGKDGKLAARFKPRTKPDAPEVTEAIEAELKK